MVLRQHVTKHLNQSQVIVNSFYPTVSDADFVLFLFSLTNLFFLQKVCKHAVFCDVPKSSALKFLVSSVLFFFPTLIKNLFSPILLTINVNFLSAGLAGKILNSIYAAGFEISALRMVTIKLPVLLQTSLARS